MAVLLSTKTGGELTGSQMRAFNQLASPRTDCVISGPGNNLVGTQIAKNITIDTGMAILDGVLIENNASVALPFAYSGSGSAMVIAKVNLITGAATIELKNGTTLTQTDLLDTPTGTREMELYRITYVSGNITGFTDKRILKTGSSDPAGLMSDLAATKTAGGFWAVIDHNIYKPSSTQSVETSNETLDFSTKLVGNLSSAGNQLTLTKGYLWVLEATCEVQTNSMNYYVGTYSGGVYTESAYGRGGHASPASAGSAFSSKPCKYVIDLTSAGSNMLVNFYGIGVGGTAVMTEKSHFSVTQYLKVPLTNM